MHRDLDADGRIYVSQRPVGGKSDQTCNQQRYLTDARYDERKDDRVTHPR